MVVKMKRNIFVPRNKVAGTKQMIDASLKTVSTYVGRLYNKIFKNYN
jgi:hypothetical protein